jgi:hypothetical protein
MLRGVSERQTGCQITSHPEILVVKSSEQLMRCVGGQASAAMLEGQHDDSDRP